MKPLLTCLLNTVIYGIVLPIAVYAIADTAIIYSCKYYWGEEYLKGDSGFKLGLWVTFYFITLTLYYYLFAFISFGFDHKLRKVSIALTIAMPIVFHYDMSDYDYRITICFAGFHLTYYVLFYGFVRLQRVIPNFARTQSLKTPLLLKMNLNKKQLSQSFNVKGIPENIEVDPRNVLLSSNTITKK